MIALWFNSKLYPDNVYQRKAMIASLEIFINQTHNVLDMLQNEIDYHKLLNDLDASSMFILGPKGNDMAIAMEGALKIKEIC